MSAQLAFPTEPVAAPASVAGPTDDRLAAGALTREPPAEHKLAMSSPAPGFERGVVNLFKAMAEYAEAHSKRYGSIIAEDYVIGEYWHWLGEALIGLLNGETGRLDCGTLNAHILNLIERGGTAESIREAVAVTAPVPVASRGKSSKPTEIKIGMRALNARQQELLANLRVENNVAVYTPDAMIPDWAELKAVMVALGGTWKTGGKGKKGGFRFADDLDAAEIVRLALETGEILDPKAAEFFETSDALADELAAFVDPGPGDVVLEPSAGKGSLIRAILRRCPEAQIVCVEPFEANRLELERLGFGPINADFLSMTPSNIGKVDHCIANPPFSGRQDARHILHALSLLPVGGRLAAIASAGVAYRDDALGRQFRDTIERNHGTITPNPDGSFAHVGTGVRTVTVTARKAKPY